MFNIITDAKWLIRIDKDALIFTKLDFSTQTLDTIIIFSKFIIIEIFI